MTDIRIDLSTLSALQAVWQQAPQLARREITVAFVDIASAMEHVLRDGDVTPIASGDLRRSIGHEVRQTASGVIGEVGTTIPYTPYVELGTKPHWVPIKPLIEWAVVKFGGSEKEAKSIAYAVREKIKKRGTTGHFMHRATMTGLQPYTDRVLQQAVNRIVSQLGGRR